jgi:hypothetical protein
MVAVLEIISKIPDWGFFWAVREGTPRTEFSIIPHFSKFVKTFSKNFLFFIFPKTLDKPEEM